MELPINRFKRALAAGQPQIGLWSSLANPTTVEVLAGAGFDWLLLDMEHSPNDVSMMQGQLHAMSESTTHAVVRPPWNDAVMIKRLLDLGVQSFLIPYVQTVQEAEVAVAATRYPPKGIRGFASASRASRYGRIRDYHGRAEQEICVLLQIETRQGLDALEAIAAVPGVDGLFIGPGDLSADLGHLGFPGHPEIVSVIEEAIDRIAKAGVAPGILTGDERLARRCLDLGCLFTAVGADTAILARGAEALAARFRDEAKA